MERIVLGDNPDVKGGVYVLRVGRHFYFGRTNNFQRRRARHLWQLGNGTHHNDILQRAFNKHGEHAVCFEPVVWCGPEDAVRIEADLITICKSVAECANLLLEDGAAFQHSESSKRKMRAARKGRAITEETRKRMSASHKRRWAENPMANEQAEYLAAFHRGRKRSLETCKRISASITGRSLSDCHRKKVSAFWRGREKDELHKLRIARSHRKPVLVVTSGGESMYFLSSRHVDTAFGFGHKKSSMILNGKRPVPKRLAGYHFSYLDKTRENWSIFPTACTHEHYGSDAP